MLTKGGHRVWFAGVKKTLERVFKLGSYALAVPVVMSIRLLRPWLLIRLGGLFGSRIGHFAANTELYLCEQEAGINKPTRHHVDLFYIANKPICNQQLATMWKRVLRVWPAPLLAPIARVNRLIPGWELHDALVDSTALDIHGLLDRFPPHLQFTEEETARGNANLRTMGIPTGTPFACLIVRDSAYLGTHQPGSDWNYHNYRDSNIQDYVLAAEEMANRGYFVIRMGAKVREAIRTNNPMIIDYATNGMRSDFMDIYLGAKCALRISTGTGWDAIPEMLRRPIVYVNYLPLGHLHTFRSEFLSITKRHVLSESRKTLSLREIFSQGVGFSLSTSDFVSKGIELIDNTPEEIRDAAVEMIERINGTWEDSETDEILQRHFWRLFPTNALQRKHRRPLHGEIRARFGAAFLRNNPWWLD